MPIDGRTPRQGWEWLWMTAISITIIAFAIHGKFYDIRGEVSLSMVLYVLALGIILFTILRFTIKTIRRHFGYIEEGK
jgi:hypothetical protein